MRIHFNARYLLYALPTVFIALVVACGVESQAPKSPAAPTETPASPAVPAAPVAPGGSGMLAVRITDGPFSEAKALLVTFSAVTAHTTDDNWVTLPFADGGSTRTCDLKRLVGGVEDVLGTGSLAEGHYTQLRLTVSSATIYFTEETSASDPVCAPSMTLSPGKEVGKPVDVPSGTVKLVRQFDVKASTTTTILLDFDGDKSIHQTGNGAYKMQPVIRILSVMQ
jgi:hypothetical protein